ncbi:MAG TPA: two-component regulator propeller domain-containing protein [Thermoanaerobaculia bacterium]|nr:two-component regulator propeller domain-containing protein [Thermoanaerobaculia bacterium]
MPRIWIPTMLAGALALQVAAAAAAAGPAGERPATERLPIRVYTIGDGLAGDEVNQVLQDSSGFLWIATDSGLSRFDGSHFASYDPRHGLPSPNVTALLEAPSGGLLVGTTGGLARFEPRPTTTGRVFQPAPGGGGSGGGGRRPGRISALLADGGAVWLADSTPGGGLFRLHPGGDRLDLVEVKLGSGAPVAGAAALALDGAGGLWVGTRRGLLHRLADGRWIECPVLPPPQREGVAALLLDAQQRLWVAATGGGLYVLRAGAVEAGRSPGGSLRERAGAGRCRQTGWPAAARMPETPGEVCRFDQPAAGMVQTRDGRIWLAANGSLSAFDGQRFRHYGGRNGLLQDDLRGMAEDRDGNLWVGTHSHGLMRIAHNGFLTYAPPEAPEGIVVAAIFEDRRARLYVWGRARQRAQLFHFDGAQLENVTPEAVDRAGYLGRGRHQVLAAEPGGDIWLGSAAGIWRFPGVEEPASLKRVPRQFWRAPEAMGEIFRLFEDSRGRLWVSSLGNQELGAEASLKTYCARWDRGSGRFSPVAEVERLGRGAPSAFAEDPFGNLWIGFSGGGLARLRAGAADLFLSADQVPAGAINDLFVDSRQRLWVASSYGGVMRVEDLDAGRPRSIAYSAAHGLSSDRVLCVTEDRRGIIYLGHGKGIDQLDPQTGRIRTLTVADGLPSSVVNVAYRARDGSLWFGTPAGLARYLPEVARSEAPPPVLLSGLRIGGVPTPLPPLGVHELAGLELSPDRNQVEVQFTGISFAYGAGLRYQYRLVGSAAGWSEPQAERSVLLGNLAPGDYRFQFRAVTPDNVVSPAPATLAFTLLRPLWQRWWFALLAAGAAAALGWAFHHARLGRMLELERVRTRIAADLHDDLSSSLSRISILSEVGRRRIADPEALEATVLDQIGETARELMEATSDIVWAIDARRDDLASLLVRIRRFAGDLLEARGVSVRFAASPQAAEIALRPTAKRELYLVLKEALHNAARHARAKEVWIEVAAVGGELVAEVRDDGVGFVTGGGDDPGSARSGRGLRNLRERAERLGGRLSVESAPGAGTRVRLSLRL